MTHPARAALDTRAGSLAARVVDLQRPPEADTTRRVTRSHMASWLRWCVSTDIDANVASDLDVVAFIAHLEIIGGLKATSIVKRIEAIGRWHRNANRYDPTSSPLVRAAVGNIKRDHAGEPHHQARPVTPREVKRLIESELLCPGGIRGMRNATLFVLLYAGALRANEAVALDVGDVDLDHAKGMVLRIRRAKGDQLGRGELVPVHLGQDVAACPVGLMRRLLACMPAGSGPLFRRISTGKTWCKGRLALSSVNYLVTNSLRDAHILPTSSHGFRRGAATQMARQNGGLDAVATLLRHSNVDQSRVYLDDADPFARVPDLLGL